MKMRTNLDLMQAFNETALKFIPLYHKRVEQQLALARYNQKHFPEESQRDEPVSNSKRRDPLNITARLHTNSLSNDMDHNVEVQLNSQLQNQQLATSTQNSLADTMRNSTNEDLAAQPKKRDSILNIEIG